MSFDAEQWLPVPGYGGFYSVSSLGRIKSRTRGILTPVKDRDGYPRVILRAGGALVTLSVHRIVCEAFNGPPNKLHREVHHIDRDRANACADNLRWVSKGENMSLRQVNAAGEKNGFSRLTENEVFQILANPNEPAKALAERFAVSFHTIYGIRRGRRWKHLTAMASPHDRNGHGPSGYDRGESK